jgi:putative lipoprotein
MNADAVHRGARAFVFVLACFALTGCPREATTAKADSEVPVSDQPIPTDTNFIHGRAFYLERIKIAPGADFTVDLVEQQHPDATIATTTLEDVAGPPYDFALQYDPAKVHADGRYALTAMLRDVDGAVLFTTPAPVAVKIGDANIVEFRMVRASAGDAPTPAGQLQRTHWTCDGMTFEAAFDVAGRRVELALPDGALSLPLAISASGARYLDHRGNEFWTKGDRGTLAREGGIKSDCVRQDAPPAAGSPWEDAKTRGIAFRAIGTEPGWMLEVGRGERPTLHAELDYGERMLDVTALQPLSGLLGYAGTGTDGTRVRLVLERRSCSDGMSDDIHPVVVRLEAGDRNYRGCGRFLAD